MSHIDININDETTPTVVIGGRLVFSDVDVHLRVAFHAGTEDQALAALNRAYAEARRRIEARHG